MSESKTERTIDTVKQEYGALVMKAGTLQYQIKVAGEDLDLVNAQLKELNLEAAAIQTKDKK